MGEEYAKNLLCRGSTQDRVSHQSMHDQGSLPHDPLQEVSREKVEPFACDGFRQHCIRAHTQREK